MSLSTTLTSSLSVAALAGALMFTGTGDANAKGPRDGAHKGHGNKMARVCKAVECTQDQQAAIKQIREEAKKDSATHREAAKKARQSLKAEFAKDNLDTAKINALYAELDRAQAGMKAEKREAKMQMHGVFTPEQREKLAKLKDKRGDRATRGKGKGKGKKGKGKKGKRTAKRGASANG